MVADNNVSENGPVPRIANIAFYLGIGSVVAMLLSIIIGFMFEIIGIINLFRSIVLPLSIAAVACGVMARRKIAAEGLKGQRIATIGLLLGATSIFMVIITVVVVALLFAPLLFV